MPILYFIHATGLGRIELSGRVLLIINDLEKFLNRQTWFSYLSNACEAMHQCCIE